MPMSYTAAWCNPVILLLPLLPHTDMHILYTAVTLSPNSSVKPAHCVSTNRHTSTHLVSLQEIKHPHTQTYTHTQMHTQTYTHGMVSLSMTLLKVFFSDEKDRFKLNLGKHPVYFSA